MTTTDKPAKPYTVNFTTHELETVAKAMTVWATVAISDTDASGKVRVSEERTVLVRFIPSIAAVALVLPLVLLIEQWSIPIAVLTFLATDGAIYNFRHLLAFLRKRSPRIDRTFTRDVSH